MHKESQINYLYSLSCHLRGEKKWKAGKSWHRIQVEDVHAGWQWGVRHHWHRLLRHHGKAPQPAGGWGAWQACCQERQKVAWQSCPWGNQRLRSYPWLGFIVQLVLLLQELPRELQLPVAVKKKRKGEWTPIGEN